MMVCTATHTECLDTATLRLLFCFPLQAHRAQISSWLSENLPDPNDPRNGPLLEMLKAQEAGHMGGSQGGGVKASFKTDTSKCTYICLFRSRMYMCASDFVLLKALGGHHTCHEGHASLHV